MTTLVRCEDRMVFEIDPVTTEAKSCSHYDAEVERANALLRHAYAVIEEAVELIGSDECTAKETLAAIKQHLGEV